MVELKDAHYKFSPREMPMVYGSPATPHLHTKYRVAYFFVALALSFSGSIQVGIFNANTQSIAAYLGLSSLQAGWLLTVYYTCYGVTSLFLFKLRQNLGVSWFKWLVMTCLITANVSQLFENSYEMALLSRAFSGISASGCLVLSLFYFIQSLPAARRLGGLVMAFSTMQLGSSLSYVLSPLIMRDGQVFNLYLFELALSFVALAGAILFRLPPTLRYKTYEPLDFLSYFFLVLFASGYCIFYIIGNIIWWDKEWLFWPFLIALLSVIILVALELPRKNPILQKNWLFNRQIFTFVVTAACLRVILSEQNTGAVGFLRVAGYNNNQLWLLYVVIFFSAIAGLALAFFRLDPKDIQRQLISSLFLISIACFMDARIGVDWIPSNFYFSQGLLAFASLYFFGPMAVEGIARALSHGPMHIVTFAVLFSSSQLIGALLGADLIQLFTTWRTQIHYTNLAGHISMIDSRITNYVSSQSSNLSTTITDSVVRTDQVVSNLASDAYLQASALAYHDLFISVGCLSVGTLIFVIARRLYHTIRGSNIIGHELAILAEKRAEREAEAARLEENHIKG